MAEHLNPTDDNLAWLETEGGNRVPIRGNCSFGRSRENTVVLPSVTASRRHALLHWQENGEYWLVDLGSSNGTHLNGKRIQHSQPLRDRDELEVAGMRFTFHWGKGTPRAASKEIFYDTTIPEIRQAACWLLVADIIGSTTLSQQMTPQALSELIGGWSLLCRHILEKHGGTMNKILGDGFVGYWKADATSPAVIHRALAEFQLVQKAYQPRFRMVLHHGMVTIGGFGSPGDEILLGQSVSFATSMEQLASSLAVACLLSEPAVQQLSAQAQAKSLGPQALKGFDGQQTFYSL